MRSLGDARRGAGKCLVHLHEVLELAVEVPGKAVSKRVETTRFSPSFLDARRGQVERSRLVQKSAESVLIRSRCRGATPVVHQGAWGADRSGSSRGSEPLAGAAGGGGRRSRWPSGTTKTDASCDATSSPRDDERSIAATRLSDGVNQRSWRASGGCVAVAEATRMSVLPEVASARCDDEHAACRMDVADACGGASGRL